MVIWAVEKYFYAFEKSKAFRRTPFKISQFQFNTFLKCEKLFQQVQLHSKVHISPLECGARTLWNFHLWLHFAGQIKFLPHHDKHYEDKHQKNTNLNTMFIVQETLNFWHIGKSWYERLTYLSLSLQCIEVPRS